MLVWLQKNRSSAIFCMRKWQDREYIKSIKLNKVQFLFYFVKYFFIYIFFVIYDECETLHRVFLGHKTAVFKFLVLKTRKSTGISRFRSLNTLKQYKIIKFTWIKTLLTQTYSTSLFWRVSGLIKVIGTNFTITIFNNFSNITRISK